MSAFLDTINIASIVVILAVIFEMSKEVFIDWRTILIAFVSFAVTFGFNKINTAFIVVGVAICGYFLSLI